MLKTILNTLPKKGVFLIFNPENMAQLLEGSMEFSESEEISTEFPVQVGNIEGRNGALNDEVEELRLSMRVRSIPVIGPANQTEEKKYTMAEVFEEMKKGKITDDDLIKMFHEGKVILSK
jgi:hypothetical protein